MTKAELIQAIGVLAADEDVLLRTAKGAYFVIDSVTVEHEEPPIHAVILLQDVGQKTLKVIERKRIDAYADAKKADTQRNAAEQTAE